MNISKEFLNTSIELKNKQSSAHSRSLLLSLSILFSFVRCIRLKLCAHVQLRDKMQNIKKSKRQCEKILLVQGTVTKVRCHHILRLFMSIPQSLIRLLYLSTNRNNPGDRHLYCIHKMEFYLIAQLKFSITSLSPLLFVRLKNFMLFLSILFRTSFFYILTTFISFCIVKSIFCIYSVSSKFKRLTNTTKLNL